MTHSGTAPCTAETDANWMDSPLATGGRDVRRGPGTHRRRRDLGPRRPMGEEIALRKALRIRRTLYTFALEGAVVGDGRRVTTCREGRRKRSCQSAELR